MARTALSTSFALLTVAAAACGSPPDPVTPPSVASAAPAAMAAPMPPPGPRPVNVSMESVGLDASALDRKADACTDFYRFACGSWLDRTQVPADKPEYARGFSSIADRNEADLRAIVEDARAGRIATPAGKKIGAFYGACVDEASIEAAGTKALDPLRRIIRRVHDEESLALAVAALHDAGINAFFSFVETQDFKDAQHVIGEIDQAGLGLPDRDFYTRDDEKSKEVRKRYVEYVEELSVLGGASAKEGEAIGEDVLRIETAIAKISKTNVQRRDVPALYHKLDRDGVLARGKHFAWPAYLSARGQGAVKDINVTSVEFLEGFDKLLPTEKREAIRRYLGFHLLSSLVVSLPKKFDDESFRFRQVLTGQEKQRERWKRCIKATDGSLGELLAQPYLEKRFGEDSKAAAEDMIGAIRAMFAESLVGLSWMDDATKKRAKTKLDAIAFQIGYPSRWKTYDFEVDAKDFAASYLRARKWETARGLAKIGKPLDKTDWDMTPTRVDAYADGQKMLMVFPAGVLQPPFFSKSYSVAVNLGGIGMVIGHELTHHFDDQGAELTETGNLESWWTPDVKTKFDAKATCVAEQYSAYEAAPGVKLNGRLTLGENIADIGGIKMAYAAYRRMRAGATETQVAEGFTEDQQFFLAMGQDWCTQMREEYARTAAQVDPHSLPKFRVNGALSDVPQFAKAFQCAEGTPMRPKTPCEVW